MRPFIAILVLSTLITFSQDKKEETKPIPEAKSFITKHQLTTGGKLIRYEAIAAETYLKKEGEPVAAIWSVTYKLDGPDVPGRPVLFIFNGGPGSASVWLHMGLFGPVMARVDSDARSDDGAAPYPMGANPRSLLDITDLVFIDPVGTGYSRVVGKGKVEDYWGLNEDAAAVATFIRLWVTKYKRWNSPKYIAGESFGTVRAAAVADVLGGDGQELSLNGLIMISQCMDYQGNTSDQDNITSFVTYFPSMAATAWYHKKAGIGRSLPEFLQEARDFAWNDYVSALYKGANLPADQRSRIADKMAGFLGLSKTYIERSDLMVTVPRFRKELLRDQGFTIGQLDGRYMAQEADAISDRPTMEDAAGTSIGSAYTSALNQYLATDLNVTMDRPYLTSNNELGAKWRWRNVPEGSYYEPSYVNVSRKLGMAMRKNKDLRVLVASGYYDLITPFFDAEYTFSRNGILQERVTMTYYEAGHMMYLHEPDFFKLTEDIRRFISR